MNHKGPRKERGKQKGQRQIRTCYTTGFEDGGRGQLCQYLDFSLVRFMSSVI